MEKIIFCVSSEMTLLNSIVPHLRKLANQYSLIAVANTRKSFKLKISGVDIPLLSTPIERNINPIADLMALIKLIKIFIKEKPAGIHSVTPKAGLLAMVAALITKVPIRVHSFTGQVWVTRKGLLRQLLKNTDRIIAAAATCVLVDSPSQRFFLINEGVIKEKESRVLGNGSMCGVDTNRFRPDPAQRRKVRQALNVAGSDILYLYLGRLNRDKGIPELGAAFANLSARHQNIQLLIVGPDEGQVYPVIKKSLSAIKERLHYFEYTNTPELYYTASDVFCLPSHREGLPSAVLEAAACGIPTVASRIYGIVDAIEDGKTGLLHFPGDVSQLEQCLERMLEPGLRKRMGAAARDRAISLFNQEIVVGAMEDLYRTLFNEISVAQ